MRISSIIKRVEDRTIAATKAAKPMVAASIIVTKRSAVRRTHAAKAAYKTYRNEVKS